MPCIPSRSSCIASSPVLPNCVMRVLAALMASRKSTLYTSAIARAASVMRLLSGPSSPVVTFVIWSCFASSALYDIHAFVASPTTAMPAPTPAVSIAVFDVSISVRLPDTPSLLPTVSMTLPKSPNLEVPPLSSCCMSLSSFLLSRMRFFRSSRLLLRALP